LKGVTIATQIPENEAIKYSFCVTDREAR
jgi:hypothetical protein